MPTTVCGSFSNLFGVGLGMNVTAQERIWQEEHYCWYELVLAVVVVLVPVLSIWTAMAVATCRMAASSEFSYERKCICQEQVLLQTKCSRSGKQDKLMYPMWAHSNKYTSNMVGHRRGAGRGCGTRQPRNPPCVYAYCTVIVMIVELCGHVQRSCVVRDNM